MCHAGVGSILTAIEHGKPVIAVPRRKKYGEHIDDHQLEITRELEKEGKITVVCDVRDLEKVLGDVSTVSKTLVENERELVKALEKYINSLAK